MERLAGAEYPPATGGCSASLTSGSKHPRAPRSVRRQEPQQAGRPASPLLEAGQGGRKKSEPQTRAQHRPAPCAVRHRSGRAPQTVHVKHFPPPQTEIPCRSPQRAVWDPGTSGNGFSEGSRPRWGSAEPRQARNYSYKARILLSSPSGRAGGRGPGRAEHSSGPYKAPPGCGGHQRARPHAAAPGAPPGALTARRGSPSPPALWQRGTASVQTPFRARAKAVVKESPEAAVEPRHRAPGPPPPAPTPSAKSPARPLRVLTNAR